MVVELKNGSYGAFGSVKGSSSQKGLFKGYLNRKYFML